MTSAASTSGAVLPYSDTTGAKDTPEAAETTGTPS